jgi:hypothetical protein
LRDVIQLRGDYFAVVRKSESPTTVRSNGRVEVTLELIE